MNKVFVIKVDDSFSMEVIKSFHPTIIQEQDNYKYVKIETTTKELLDLKKEKGFISYMIDLKIG